MSNHSAMSMELVDALTGAKAGNELVPGLTASGEASSFLCLVDSCCNITCCSCAMPPASRAIWSGCCRCCPDNHCCAKEDSDLPMPSVLLDPTGMPPGTLEC